MWGLNGRAYPYSADLLVHEGRRYRFHVRNASMMEHPMHLHGHSFKIVAVDGASTAAIVKDTVVVRPMTGSVSIDVEADNPGAFLFHRYNDLHMEGGLAAVMRYDARS